MDSLLPYDLGKSVLIGVGATAVMDAWLLTLKRAGVPTTSFSLIGRWVGHLMRGRFWHTPISTTPRIAGETGIGWLTHYFVGIAYAYGLVVVQGAAWIRQPTLGPALAVGVGTVVVPLFIVQPAMGAGFAGKRTQTPLKNFVRSLANHTVFGFGLYLAAVSLASIFSR